jgi:hypothetical protein
MNFTTHTVVQGASRALVLAGQRQVGARASWHSTCASWRRRLVLEAEHPSPPRSPPSTPPSSRSTVFGICRHGKKLGTCSIPVAACSMCAAALLRTRGRCAAAQLVAGQLDLLNVGVHFTAAQLAASYVHPTARHLQSTPASVAGECSAPAASSPVNIVCCKGGRGQ